MTSAKKKKSSPINGRNGGRKTQYVCTVCGASITARHIRQMNCTPRFLYCPGCKVQGKIEWRK